MIKKILPYLAGVAVIAVIAFAFFYPDAMQGNELRQHDMQQGVANSHETVQYMEMTGETPRWTGSLFSGMPTFQITPRYASASLYMWFNKVMGLGLPGPSGLIAMMMMGFFILLVAMRMRWYIALIGAIAYGFSTYFVIIIGAGHLWKFYTLAYVPPTIAGVIVAYRGRYLGGAALAAFFAMMQIANNHVQMSYYFMYVIAGIALAALWSAWREKKTVQWLKATGALAIAATLAVTANLPNLYNTYEYSKLTMRGQHSELTQPGAATAATGGLDKDYITQYSYQPSETFSLLIPNIKGGASARPSQGQFVSMNLSDLDDARDYGQMEQQYLQYMSQYFGDPEGTNGPVYVGALIFAMFLLGCVIVKGPLKWALVVLTVFSIVLAWGKHAMAFTDLMLNIAPMYSKFRTVESILVIAEFTMPLLAVMALQQLVSTPEGWSRYRKPMMWSFGISAALCLIAWLAPGMFGSAISDNDRLIDGYITQQLMQQGYDGNAVRQFSLSNPTIYSAVETLRYGMVKSDALRSLLLVIAGGLVLVMMMRGRLRSLPAVGIVALLVLIDLYNVNKRYLSHDSFAPKQLTVGAPIAMTPADRSILQDTAMNYRVMDIPRFFSADPSYYHKTIGGYHAAKLTRYQDLIDRHLSHFTKGTQTDADWNVLNMLNARYVVGMDGQPLFNPEAMGNAWWVDRVVYADGADDEMARLGEIDPAHVAVADMKFRPILGDGNAQTAPGDTIVETSYAPDRLTYRTRSQHGGVAVFSEIYFPWGWEATVDGQPAELARVNYVLRAMHIPAGEHEVVLTFAPASVRTTTAAATTAVIIIYLGIAGWLFLSWRRSRKESAGPGKTK